MIPDISVLMPVYNGERFFPRAIESLRSQENITWELIVIDDGSTDLTRKRLLPYGNDERITICAFDENHGLGHALNIAGSLAHAPYIAYLPADDVYYRTHLESLLHSLEQDKKAVLAFSGIRYRYNRFASGQVEGESLQLVQILHKRVDEKWVEREELVTDDLERMFWGKLRSAGNFINTAQVSCEWVDHPLQRHKLIREPEGGINRYKDFYGVKHPIRYHSTAGNFSDEIHHYEKQRARIHPKPTGLKILIVGELAYNADRILALRELGHSLYGLWTPNPYWYNTIGPVPFGHIEDIRREGWVQTICRLKPDIIYALLNWQAVPFAHEVLKKNPGIPFVWHFKEGPFVCLEKGTWPQLVDLYRYSSGQIFCSEEMRMWVLTAIPDLSLEYTLVLDGDLPKVDWFKGVRAHRLSTEDGEIHTVVPGRPIGLHPETLLELSRFNIHLHSYGDFTHMQWKDWIEKGLKLAPRHLHLHKQVRQDRWVEEFSKYDAGWLHTFKSENLCDITRANWDDLNMPARMSTLAAAGLPLLQRDNRDSIVATDRVAREMHIGISYKDISDLASSLRNRSLLSEISDSMWKQREFFSFDSHAETLINFFMAMIDRPRSSRKSAKIVPFHDDITPTETFSGSFREHV